ncbi:virulence factor MviN, partial [Micromonospora craterilacus]
AAVAGFAPGLLGYGLFAVLSRALYARGATRAATAAISAGWLVVLVATLPLAALLPVADRVLAVALANSVGMLLLGGLLLVAVLRVAGRAALDGAARAGAAGLLAGTTAALAALALLSLLNAGDGTPTRWVALVQGMLSGVLVGVVFLGVVWLVDRRDVQPLLAGLRRRLRRGRTRPGQEDGKEPVSR